MRAMGFIASGALVGLVMGGMAAPAAHASSFGFELNAVYRVISNGEWAKTNDVFMDEAVVVQTWTLTSSCTTPHDCTGEVVSDQGWTAPLVFRTTRWIVDRFHPTWLPCPDGTTSPGRQRYQFQATDAHGQLNPKDDTQLTGYDRTTGYSGACGRNQQTVVTMPLTMDKM